MIVGLKSIDQDRLDLMRSLKATRWQTLRLVELPTALPFIFAGLDVAVIFSVLGVIVAEFVGSQAGLGNLLLSYNAALDISAVFAGLILLGVMGMVLHLAADAMDQAGCAGHPLRDDERGRAVFDGHHGQDGGG